MSLAPAFSPLFIIRAADILSISIIIETDDLARPAPTGRKPQSRSPYCPGVKMVKESKSHPALLPAGIFFVVLVAALIFMPHGLKRSAQGGFIGALLPEPTEAEAADVNSWAQAVRKVKEDRGEPAGKDAKVETPAQLRLYSDKRRFLAVQVAEWRERHLNTPRDFVDLASMLGRGELVELPSVTRDYILFGVGGNSNAEPFTCYENGESIPLYSQEGLEKENARIEEARAPLKEGVGKPKKSV